MTATLQSNVPQSKWGFHACDYETFKKVKLIHKHYWLAKYAQAACDRYYNKKKENRVIKSKGVVIGPMKKPFFPKIYEQLLKKPIVPLYQQARHPLPSPEMVRQLNLSIFQINELIAELKGAFDCTPEQS